MKEKIEKREPPMDNLPDGIIDWAEISNFIEDILYAYTRSSKGWKSIYDTAATESLQENSVTVMKILYSDLYDYFFEQHDDRLEVWCRMEAYIRTKYSGLSPKALSRIIAVYRIDDR